MPPFPVEVDKARTQHFLFCLERGEPIGRVLTLEDMLKLAGACYCMLISQAPAWRRAVPAWQRLRIEPPQQGEHTEAAAGDNDLNNVRAAVELVLASFAITSARSA